MSEPSDALTKAQRLSRISLLLYRHPQGVAATELARLCAVSKRTILRDLADLAAAGIPLWDDEDEPGRGAEPPHYGILGGYYLPPIHLSLDDALALYLAARLLARYADEFDPHIVHALAKLAAILPEGIAQHVHATIRNLASRHEDERLVQVLGVLAVGWATGRAVRIIHQAATSERTRECLFKPYFIEPSAVGNATYVIGWASYCDGLRTFKVERIMQADLTEERFVIPDDFDGPELLSRAWGIWYGETSEEVTLRFSPEVTRRVRETHWHPSQQLAETEDGGCILRLWVADPREMVYWVRGWAPGVEVLSPTWMREQIAHEAVRTRELYGG